MKRTSEKAFSDFLGGNAQAFTRLHNETYTTLFWFAHNMVRNTADAQDIVADVFLKLWQNRSQTGLVEDMESYLHRMVRNACIDFIRRSKIKEKVEMEISYRLENENDQAWNQALVKAEVLDFFSNEVKKLSPKYTQVFDLSFIEGRENEEVAEELNISYQVLRNMQTKIRKVLRLSILSPAVVCGLFLITRYL